MSLEPEQSQAEQRLRRLEELLTSLTRVKGLLSASEEAELGKGVQQMQIDLAVIKEKLVPMAIGVEAGKEAKSRTSDHEGRILLVESWQKRQDDRRWQFALALIGSLILPIIVGLVLYFSGTKNGDNSEKMMDTIVQRIRNDPTLIQRHP